MNRARVIVKEISIRRKGEVQFFQIRLPKNVIRIRGVEYDAFMISHIDTGSPMPDDPALPGGGMSGGIGHEPVRNVFLKWTHTINPVLGKLKLQSMDRNNLFFETWLAFQHYGSGLQDMSFGLFPKSPYTLNRNNKPKHLDLLCGNQLINGMFEDNIGLRQNTDLYYRIKVFVWIETTEDAKGVKYDFQETPGSDELQIKI